VGLLFLLQLPAWANVIAGIAALDRVKAAGRPTSAFGEGLADALNVGGI